MKKQRKPRSQPQKRKAYAAPLPLDTSRGLRPAAPKTANSAQRPSSNRRAPNPARRAVPIPSDLASLWQSFAPASRLDRMDAAMLALPILLIALTIAVGRWTNADRKLRDFATLTPGAKHALVGLPPVASPVTPLLPAPIATLDPAPAAASVGELTLAVVKPIDATPAPLSAAALDPQVPSVPNPLAEAVAPSKPGSAAAAPPPNFENTIARTPKANESVAALNTAPEPQPPVANAPTVTAAILPPDRAATAWELPGGEDALAAGVSQCRFEPPPPRTPLHVSWTPGNPESFGLALAAAARSQLKDFVIYNDRYTRLKFPMGDVHPMYGVCTDVVIRAYRVLGVDLQELVQKTKSGSGDPNIDHRRVDTLRKFFSRFGESLPISTFAEDYKPGDIVTYWRPQNRHSRTHIAVVSDMTGPSGRPLIIHNRGWGPQQEDGLFVDEITGHYRFSGLKSPTEAKETAAPQTSPAAKPAATRRTREAKPTRPVVRTGFSSPATPRL